MSWLCDSTELISGAWLSSAYEGHGVRGDAIPASGADGPSPLYPCVTLPADAAVEVRGEVTYWPTLGTLTLAEDHSFVYVGATDYYEFRLYADGAASTVDVGRGPGIVRVSLSVGTVVSAFTAGAVLGAVVAGGALGANASAFTAGAVLGALVASGTLSGAPAQFSTPRYTVQLATPQTVQLATPQTGQTLGLTVPARPIES